MREVRCTSCGKRNRVAAGAESSIPVCGACRSPLPAEARLRTVDKSLLAVIATCARCGRTNRVPTERREGELVCGNCRSPLAVHSPKAREITTKEVSHDSSTQDLYSFDHHLRITPQLEEALRDCGVIVILCDVSGSMAEHVGFRTRYEHMKAALKRLAPVIPSARLIAFSSTPEMVASVEELPAPSGGTALDLALLEAAALKPSCTVIISDGEPFSPHRCTEIAKRVPGRIVTIFVGGDGEEHEGARAFLEGLARSKGGTFASHDFGRPRQDLASTVINALVPRQATALERERGW